MQVTEAEAKQKFCPHLKANCIGSGCMAWREGYNRENLAEHEAREYGPWDAESESETLAMLMAICGVELVERLQKDPASRDNEGEFCESELTEEIDALITAHYESKIDAFKAANKPEGEGWEESSCWADQDGMYVEWVKRGPPVGYCGHMR